MFFPSSCPMLFWHQSSKLRSQHLATLCRLASKCVFGRLCVCKSVPARSKRKAVLSQAVHAVSGCSFCFGLRRLLWSVIITSEQYLLQSRCIIEKKTTLLHNCIATNQCSAASGRKLETFGFLVKKGQLEIIVGVAWNDGPLVIDTVAFTV